jgi:Ca2+-binding RTX toxin-like protein
MANRPGTVGNDTLTGTNGTDFLNNLDLGGEDFMVGGQGNDRYIVNSFGDTVVELINGGNDRVESSISYTLTANVENLTLTGLAAINGIGNNLNNMILGNQADNIIDGGAGNDNMQGGLGDDSYFISSTSDTVSEIAGAGTDTVNSPVTYSLGANLENLVLSGIGNINGTGNTSANTLTGNAGNNILNGGLGIDTLQGGLGNDTYVVDGSDIIIENASAGIDLVLSTANYTLGANIENLTLTGTAAINGTGNALDNVLTGNNGINILAGLGGNDTYVVNSTQDQVIEAAGGGIDTVNSSATYTLGVELENLSLTSTNNIDGTGNAANNIITGGNNANVLSGLVGYDTINGGGGNDTIVGGLGADVLTGGTGRDIFKFATGDSPFQLSGGIPVGQDTITDFGSGDRIDLPVATLMGNQNVANALFHVGNYDGYKITTEGKITLTHLGANAAINTLAEVKQAYAFLGLNVLPTHINKAGVFHVNYSGGHDIVIESTSLSSSGATVIDLVGSNLNSLSGLII